MLEIVEHLANHYPLASDVWFEIISVKRNDLCELPVFEIEIDVMDQPRIIWSFSWDS